MTQLTAGHEITIDWQRRILLFRIWGTWTEQDLERYETEYLCAVERLGPRPFSVLGDSREAPPLPGQDERVQRLIGHSIEHGARTVAIAVSLAAAEMFYRRMHANVQMSLPTSDEQVEVHFGTDLDEVRSWLLHRTRPGGERS